MTIVLLLEAIKSFIQEVVADNVSTVPAVHLGLIPDRTEETQDRPEYPCIIVRPMSGTDEIDNSQPIIKLLFCTQSEDDDGYLELINLMERVRIALLTTGILDNRYRIDRPYDWAIEEGQPDPCWIGEATTRWTMPTVHEEVPGI